MQHVDVESADTKLFRLNSEKERLEKQLVVLNEQIIVAQQELAEVTKKYSAGYKPTPAAQAILIALFEGKNLYCYSSWVNHYKDYYFLAQDTTSERQIIQSRMVKTLDDWRLLSTKSSGVKDYRCFVLSKDGEILAKQLVSKKAGLTVAETKVE